MKSTQHGWVKRCATLPVAAAICIALATLSAHAAEKAARLQVPKHWKFSLPAGDAEAGKQAFVKMQCYSCHKVPGAEVPAERSSGGVGPDLVPAYGALPREFLAESIVDSHKYISGTLEKYTGLDKVSSKMGDYGSIMSVRELIDIVEFLKQLGPPPASSGR